MPMQYLISSKFNALFSLLSYELFRLPLQEELTAADWSAVLEEGNRQAVTALLYPGMKKLSGIPEEARSRVRRTALASAKSFEQRLHFQQEIIALLETHTISCAVLKGTSVSCLYPDPGLRVSGDVDLLVDKEKLFAAGNLLEENGFIRIHEDERHFCFQKENIEVEIHPSVTIFPNTPKGSFSYAYMQKALQHTTTAQFNGINFPVLSGVYQLIALLAHMEHHLISSGIGLRQVCDWAATVNSQRNAIGPDEIEIMEQCGLLFFAKLMTRLCEKYFGMEPLDWSADAPDDLVELLMQDVLEGGNFNSQYTLRPFYGILTDVYITEDRKKCTSLRSYVKYIRKRSLKDFPWAKNQIWVAVFCIYYPVRLIMKMLFKKRKKFNLIQAARSAQNREKLFQQFNLYK